MTPKERWQAAYACVRIDYQHYDWWQGDFDYTQRINQRPLNFFCSIENNDCFEIYVIDQQVNQHLRKNVFKNFLAMQCYKMQNKIYCNPDKKKSILDAYKITLHFLRNNVADMHKEGFKLP